MTGVQTCALPISSLLGARRRIGEILVGSGYLTQPALDAALATRPAGRRIGEHLVAARVINEESLYEALSLQQALPTVHLEPRDVAPAVARAIPERILRQWGVLPFRIAGGGLHLAAPEAPSSPMMAALAPFTTLELRFHLMTPSAFARLSSALL